MKTFSEEQILSAFTSGWNAHMLSNEGSYHDRVKALNKFSSTFTKPVRIIFLDIDGVLNNSMDSDRHIGEDDAKGRLYSPRCVELLNKLTCRSGAKIVVSSTWRMGRSFEEMASVLKHIGVEGEMIGMTDVLNDMDTFRGNEILKWIKDNPDIVGDNYLFRDYVILDDDSDMLLWQKDNYVNCDPTVGMTDRTVYKALSILLNAPCEDVGQEFVQ